jgi:hypothetical protein
LHGLHGGDNFSIQKQQFDPKFNIDSIQSTCCNVYENDNLYTR